MTDASGPIPVTESNLESAHRRSEIEPKYAASLQPGELESSPKYVATPNTAISEESLKETFHAGQTPYPRGWWRSKWLWVAIVGIIVIAAAIGGALGGSLGKSSDSPDPPSKPEGASSTTTPASASTTTAATMSGTATALAKYFYPTPVSDGSNAEVLAQGPDQSIYGMYSTTSGSTEDDLSLSSSSLMQLSSSAVPWQHGVTAFVDNSTEETHIFAVFRNGDHNSLYHRYHNSNMTWLPFGGWEVVNGSLGTGASVVHWPATTPVSNDGVTWLFAIDAQGQLRALNFTSASIVEAAGWNNIGGTWSSYTPTLVSTTRGTIHVFVVYSVTKEVYWGYYDGELWQPNGPELITLGGYSASKPTVVSSKPGRLSLFAIGGDGGLWVKQYVAGSDKWIEEWDCISGNSTISGEVEAITWGGNGDEKWIDVFAWSKGGALLHKWYDNGSWLPSQDGFDVIAPGPFAGPPKAVEIEGKLHVFAYDADYTLVHVWQQGSGRWTLNTKIGQETLGGLPHS